MKNHHIFRTLSRIVSRSGSDRRGSIAVMTAILAPIMVGVVALTVDAAYWRYRQTVLQAAADAGAIGASYDLQSMVSARGSSYTSAGFVPYAGKTSILAGNWLQSTATFDAKRNCDLLGMTCNSVATWPYTNAGGTVDYNAIVVTASDTVTKRFFSGIISSSAKIMSGRAVATAASRTSTSGGGGSVPDDGCLLALNGYVSFWNPNSGVGSTCTVIADNGDISLNSGPNVWIKGTAYTTGNAYTQNMNGAGGFGATKTYQPAIADPYANSTVYPTILRTDNGTVFPNQNSTSSSVPCNDYYGGFNMQTNDLAGHNSALVDCCSTGNPYTGSSNQDNAGHVNAMHPFKGFSWNNTNNRYEITGGARFCKGIAPPGGATLYFGPGTYILEYAANLSSNTLILDQATLIIGNMNGNYNWNSVTLKAKAAATGTAVPTFGPTGSLATGIAGIVMTTLPNVGASFPVNGNNIWYFQGDIYMPILDWTSQQGAVLSAASFDSSWNTVAVGNAACGRIIVKSFYSASSSNVGDLCQPTTGVQPFGTPYGTAGSGAGWSTSGGTTTTRSYPKVSE